MVKYRIITASLILFLNCTTKVIGGCPTPDQITESVYTILTRSPKDQTQQYFKLWVAIKNCTDTPDSIKGLVCHRLGAAYFLMQDYSTANKYTSAGLSFRKRGLPQKHSDIGNSYYNLSKIAEARFELRESLGYLFQAKEIYQQTNNSKLFDCLSDISDLYRRFGDYEKAREVLQLALFLAKDTPNAIGLYIGSGNAHIEFGRQKEALQDYFKALKLYEKYPELIRSEPDNYATILNNIGECYTRNQQYPEANRHLQKALGHYSKGYTSGRTYSLLSLAYLSDKQNSWATAMAHCDDARKSARNSLSKFKVFYCEASISLHQPRFALDRIQKAMQTMGWITMNANPNIGNIQKIGDKREVLKCLRTKVEAAMQIPEYLALSLETALKADSLIDLMRREHTEEASKLFWRQDTHQFYENAIEICFRLKDNHHAFYFMEKSRAILLLDALKNLNARELLSPALQEQEQNLRYVMLGREARLEKLASTDKAYPKASQDYYDTKATYQKFIESLEKTNPAYYALKFSNKYVSLPQWKTYLADNQQNSLQFFTGEKVIYLLAVKPEGTVFRKINKAEYQTAQQTFEQYTRSKIITKTELAAFRVAAESLFKLVIEPFNFTAKRLLISPDGGFIPYAAMLSSSGKYLIETHALSYAYSANVVFQHSPSTYFRQASMLAVAPVNYVALPTLPETDITARKIISEYFSGKVFSEAQATKTAFLNEAKNHRIIQLFTHCRSDSSGADIAFHDTNLSLNELYKIGELSANLAVLSACQTHVGQAVAGEGVLSFARGFAYLGVPSTVATLWRVDSRATNTLTELFYEALADGQPKDIALQNAQTQALQEQMLPYYWANFVLMGDSRPLPKGYFGWGIGLILVTGLAGLWYFRKKLFGYFPNLGLFQQNHGHTPPSL